MNTTTPENMTLTTTVTYRMRLLFSYGWSSNTLALGIDGQKTNCSLGEQRNINSGKSKTLALIMS